MSKNCTCFGPVVRKLVEGVSLVTMDMCELDADSVRFCMMQQCSYGSGNPFGFQRSEQRGQISDYKSPSCFLIGPMPFGCGVYLRCVTPIAI